MCACFYTASYVHAGDGEVPSLEQHLLACRWIACLNDRERQLHCSRERFIDGRTIAPGCIPREMVQKFMRDTLTSLADLCKFTCCAVSCGQGGQKAFALLLCSGASGGQELVIFRPWRLRPGYKPNWTNLGAIMDV